MRSYKNQPVAHYLKSDFPDQRFLPLRLYLHSRTVKDKLPDLTFFEFLQSSHKISKKLKSRLTPIKSNKIFEHKEKVYKELFTNGKVSIRNDASEFRTGKLTLPTKVQEKFEKCVEKTRSKSQKKNFIPMLINTDKKKVFSSSRKVKKLKQFN